jgi:hypothetical protein
MTPGTVAAVPVEGREILQSAPKSGATSRAVQRLLQNDMRWRNLLNDNGVRDTAAAPGTVAAVPVEGREILQSAPG